MVYPSLAFSSLHFLRKTKIQNYAPIYLSSATLILILSFSFYFSLCLFIFQLSFLLCKTRDCQIGAIMDQGSGPRTVEDIFLDFKGRRSGIIKALATDFEDFYQNCDPEGENLCLYGHPNEQWEVKMPEKERPPEIPDPAMGINLARDGMEKYEWMAFVAVHSDSWLLSVAFFFGAGLDKTDRKRLFDMINDLPTIYEVLFATELKPLGPWTSLVNPESNSKGFRYRICGACEENFATGEFRIHCNECEEWFHGVCVNITSRRAEKMKTFYCAPCQKRLLQ